MKSLVSALKRTADLRGWQVSNLRKKSAEVYFVGDELETVRCNSVQNYALRIQTHVDQDHMGESATRFQGKPDSLSALIDETRARARLVRNPAYNFSAPYEKKKETAPISDAAIDAASLDALIAYANKIKNFRQKNLSRYPLNSMELFFEEYDYRIRNHRGLDVGAESTRVVCDYVLTSPDNRHEIMGIKKRRFLSALKLEEQFEDDAAVLSDLEAATLPPTGEFPVVLAGDALDNLFDFFVAQLDGHALFNRYSIFQKGDMVVRDAREPLTISSDATIPGGMRSYLFDDLGFEAHTVKLIDETRVENFLVDGRYADLLKIPKTSALMNISVSLGQTPYGDFLSDGVLELSKFSTFQPNTISGAFSGEIRLGYLHRGGKRIPIKGGSVSGSTQTAFVGALKSSESVQRASYSGPKGVFFERLTVAGE